MELKVFRFLGFDEIHPDAKMGSLYYRKSQVDKLIEIKDKAFEYSQAVILVDIEIIKKHKIKRCLAMAEWCEATALWCYQAANTLPVGIHATLYGKPVMIEPKRLFKRFELLNKWKKRWISYSEKIKKG
jgi:hypothetical protein